MGIDCDTVNTISLSQDMNHNAIKNKASISPSLFLSLNLSCASVASTGTTPQECTVVPPMRAAMVFCEARN